LVTTTVVLRGRSQVVPNREKEEQATPVQKGVMTEKELYHSKIYKKEYEWRNARRLATLKANRVTLLPPSIPSFGPSIPPTGEDLIRSRYCEADAAVIGTIASKSSQLTEDGTFTFTTYQLRVTQVLKNNPAASLVVNSIIDITRPRGAIVPNGRTILTRDLSFPLLEMTGAYLLFLRFISSTGAYKSFKPGGDFEIQADTFSALTEAVREGCHFCFDSAEFYVNQQLNDPRQRRSVLLRMRISISSLLCNPYTDLRPRRKCEATALRTVSGRDNLL
jgi:hypothetical protein